MYGIILEIFICSVKCTYVCLLMLHLFIFFMLEPVMDPFVAIVSHLPEVQAVTNVEARLHPKGRMLFDLYKDTGIKA